MQGTVRPASAAVVARLGTLLLLAASLVCAAPAAVRAQEKGEVNGQVTWDTNYLYFAFQVDDADILGTNKLPLSRVEEDDSIGVYLHVGGDRAAVPNSATHAMVVSVAGGFSFLTGDADRKALVPRPLFTIKFGVTTQGTLNRSDDRDQRYIVEMAIPWKEIGVDPATLGEKTELAVNFVARQRGGGFSASSPQVKTAADIASPAKWQRLYLRSKAGADVPAGGVAASPVVQREGKDAPPLIDGIQRVANEWPSDSRFSFAAAVPAAGSATPVKAPERPTAPEVSAPSLTLSQKALTGMERLVFARYRVDYQADLRKAVPFRGVVDVDAARITLADHPTAGIGPWFSTDRASWHRQQLADMRSVGIDVALVEVGGPADETGVADEKALLVMTAALREMTFELLPTPQVALCIDTSRLTAANQPKLNLSTDAGVEALYRAIRRFFTAVPTEFRARVQLPLAAGGVPAYPVFLSDGTALAGVEGGEWADALRRRFAADFGTATGGATLLFAGGANFDAKNPGLVAVAPLRTGGKGLGTASSFVVQPGVDVPGGALVPRKATATYRNSWKAALEAQPYWYIIDSWNDWSRATEITASREYGPQYLDLTRIYSLQIGGLPERDIRWLAHDAPRRLQPGQIVTMQVTLQNAGRGTLDASQGVALTYRWFKDGKAVSEGPLRLTLDEPLPATRTRRLTIGLAAIRILPQGKVEPLPPGEYIAQIDLVRPSDPANRDSTPIYFSDDGDVPLSVPVTITNNLSETVLFDGSSVPPLMQAGGAYPVTVRLRWLGPDLLPATSANLTYQVLSADGSQLISTGSAPLSTPLSPGAPTVLRALIELKDAGGVPIQPSFPELPAGRGVAGGGYRLRWLLTRTDSTETIPGEYVERVAVYGGDEEARILPPQDMPEKMTADAQVTTEVTVINRGSQKWEKGQYAVGHHWYYADGIEAAWRSGIPAMIDRDVAPGQAIKLKVPVRAPEHDGPYVVAFDVLKLPETYLSTRPVTRTGDIALAYVRVSGGRLTFVDLSKLFDTDAVAAEEKPDDGDLDGKGATFPAEAFPPDVFGLNAPGAPIVAKPKNPDDPREKVKVTYRDAPAYPSGYWTDISSAARRIAFRYGPDADGAKNALASAGQTIPVKSASYGGLHIAAVATGGTDLPMTVTLNYKNKTSEKVTLRVPDWNRPVAATGDAVAIGARRKRTPSGDVRASCAVRHLVIPLDVRRELVSFTLPNDPKIKVFAVTLDR
ncbi:MAG TPA: sugar-binding protein [Armatimonadaceae bacterium]|nr:sugar-binding protein [Armatimonadaceae bacterium]